MSFLSQDFNPYSFKVATNEKDFQLNQNVEAYKEYAKQQRDLDELAPSARQYRSYAIIPDIVAIDMLTKHGLDIHAPDFMHHPANLVKLKRLIDTEYPALKTSNVRSL
jgi:hypothetical protein